MCPETEDIALTPLLSSRREDNALISYAQITPGDEMEAKRRRASQLPCANVHGVAHPTIPKTHSIKACRWPVPRGNMFRHPDVLHRADPVDNLPRQVL